MRAVNASKGHNLNYIHPSAYVEAKVGDGTRVWHFCHISELALIGCNCVLGQNVYVGPGVKIGDRVRIQNNVSVYEGVTLGDDVFIGPSVVFTNVHQPDPHGSVHGHYDRTIVRAGAMIGANATIIAPCVIGEGAVVGAGSVVTKDVTAGTTVVGNPARAIKRDVWSVLP